MKLRIYRGSCFADRTRNYQIICNGNTVGEIGNGETIEFEIGSNNPEVYLTIDWCRSNKLTVTPSSNGVIHLLAESSLSGFKLLLALFYILLMPTQYIRLSQVDA